MALTLDPDPRASAYATLATPVVVAAPRRRPLRDAATATLPAWIAARIAVGFGVVLATVTTDQLGVRHPAPLVDKLLAWDAHHYRDLADHGYRAVPYGFRFFPLFPLIVRALGTAFAGHTDVAAIVLANGCAFGLGMAAYRLVLLETANARVARLTTWLLLASPAAVPLAMGYAESLGLLAAVLAFLAVRQSRWGWAAVAAGVVGATWSIGALLVIPMALEAWHGWRDASRRERVLRAGTVVAPLVTTTSYLLWVQWETGHWYEDVFGVQAHIYHRGFAEPVSRLLHAAHDLLTGHHAEGIAFPWAVVAIVLLVVVFRRLPLSYAAWSAAIVVIDLGAHNLDSFERYALRAFPLVIGGALCIRTEREEWLTLSVALAGLVVYTTAILVGAKVP